MSGHTDFLCRLADEAMEHAERHGFAAYEDFDGFALLGEDALAVFRVLSRSACVVLVEVIDMSSTISHRELSLLDEFMGGVHPDAAFLDELEALLVEAKRQIGRP